MSASAKDDEVPAASGGGRTPVKTLYCSFCFKSQHDVKTLVAGPASIYICDECVGSCNDVVAGRLQDQRNPPADKELPTERLLERLQAIEQTLQGKGNQLQWAVERLRSTGVSWSVIGAALGVSRQSAWERFT